MGEIEIIVNNDFEDYDVYIFFWLSLLRYSVLVLFIIWILVGF